MARRIELLSVSKAAENVGNADDIAEMWAEDAVMMVPDQPVYEGKTGVARRGLR